MIEDEDCLNQVAKLADEMNEKPDDEMTPTERTTFNAQEREVDLHYHPITAENIPPQLTMEKAKDGVAIDYKAYSRDLARAAKRTTEAIATKNPFMERREEIITEIASAKNSLRRSGRIEPMRGRLLVARVSYDDAIGSITIPEEYVRARTQLNEEAVVLACGKPRYNDAGEEIPVEVEPGDHVIIRPHAGLLFDWYDDFGRKYECYLIAQIEVIAKLHPTGPFQHTADLAKTLLALNPVAEPEP